MDIEPYSSHHTNIYTLSFIMQHHLHLPNVSNVNGVINSGAHVRPKRLASMYLVPILSRLLNLKDTQILNAINECVVGLDQLAILVDSNIDGNQILQNSRLTIDKVPGLREKIRSSLLPLSNYPRFKFLLEDIYTHINISFRYNTTERHYIYNLSQTTTERCTSYYLIPLVKYLCYEKFARNETVTLFILLSNYIQIIDDFVDLPDDLEKQIVTPILLELGDQFDSNFDFTLNNILAIMQKYLTDINTYMHHLSSTHGGSYSLKESYRLHSYISSLPLPKNISVALRREYFSQIKDALPPMLCYGI